MWLFAATVFSVNAEVLLPDSVENYLRRTPKDSAYVSHLNNIAFSFLKSNPEVGRLLAERNVEFARSVNFAHGEARALNIVGSSYWVVGDYEPALKYYHASALVAEDAKDRVALAEAYHNMGEVYKKLGDYTKAIEFIRMSMRWESADDQIHDLALYNIGEAYLYLSRYDSALNYFDRALSMALKSNNTRTIAYAYTGLGRVKSYKGDQYQALAYYTKAEKLWKEMQELRSLIQTYEYFAETFTTLTQYGRALEYVNMAIVLSDEIHANDLQVTNYYLQSNLYVKLGDLKRGMAALQQYAAIKDTLYHERRREEVARLQAEFESGARELENQQLKAAHALQDAQIRNQKFMLVALTSALVAAAIMAYIYFRQRKRVAEVNHLLSVKSAEIQKQKEEIESQATELKHLNEQLQELNRSLESKIEERTRTLTWQNQKLNEYAHFNAHQLRAPVVSILGLLQLIDRLELPEADHELIRQLQTCGKDLDRITRMIARTLEE